MDKEEHVGIIPEFEATIERGRASFTQLVEVIFHQREQFNSDPDSRRAHAACQQKIHKAFEETHGGVERFYEANNVVAAAVLTEKGHFEYICPIKTASVAAEQLLRLSTLDNSVKQFLHGKELKTSSLDLFAASTFLIKVVDDVIVDDKSFDPDDIKKRIAFASSILDNVERRIEPTAQRNAQLDYCTGMFAGCVTLTFISSALFFSSLPLNVMIGAVLGGTLGATISVLTRITKGQLKLQYEAGRKLIFLLGLFRPIIGAASAIFTWSLISSSILPIEVKTTKDMLFFFSTGFIAGFSERWAQDMFSMSKSAILNLNVKEDQGQQLNSADAKNRAAD